MAEGKGPTIDEIIERLPLTETTRTIITCLGFQEPLAMAKRLKIVTSPPAKEFLDSMGLDYIEYLKNPTKYRERILSFLPEDKRRRLEKLEKQETEIIQAAIPDINKAVEPYSRLIEICDEITQLQSDASVNAYLRSKELTTPKSSEYLKTFLGVDEKPEGNSK